MAFPVATVLTGGTSSPPDKKALKVLIGVHSSLWDNTLIYSPQKELDWIVA
jgi:hypothetical protein